MKLILFTLGLLIFPTLVPAQNCGSATSETPVPTTSTDQTYAGKVSSLRGRVLYTNEKPAENVIVELYRDTRPDPGSRNGYLDVNEVIKNKRITARYVESGGRFCFKNVKPGRYMVRVGMLSNFQWEIQSIFVTLVPPKIQKARKSLEVILWHAI